MSLKAKVRENQSAAIVELAGKATLGDGANTIRKTVDDLIAEGHKKIVLDLEGVSYMDSAGLGSMVSGFNRARSAGGDLKLINLQKRVLEVLEATNLNQIISVCTSEEAAIRSFGTT